MKLNCKQGDLAIIVKSGCGNEGKIVRCVEFSGVLIGVRASDGKWYRWRGGPRAVWKIDRSINFGNSVDIVQIEYCSDEKLRPLRGDLDDETITEGEELSTHV